MDITVTLKAFALVCMLQSGQCVTIEDFATYDTWGACLVASQAMGMRVAVSMAAKVGLVASIATMCHVQIDQPTRNHHGLAPQDDTG